MEIIAPVKVFNNNYLFSNNYLEKLVQSPEWKKEEHIAAFSEIKKLYTSQSAFFDGLLEQQLRERFFNIIFRKILPYYEVEETKRQDAPDYAFFPDQDSMDNAHKSVDVKSFFGGALALGEVKRWDLELDRFGKDLQDKRRNPSFQMWLYLNDIGINWGILSNGRKWRLYRKDKPLDVYYEIDLVSLLEKNDLEGFKYYYYFFRREAFLPNEAGEIFLDNVLKGSDDYRNKIGNNLKENVYRAMKKIAEGFFSWPENQLSYNDPKTRDQVQKNTMVLLYRLLFLLFAEGKGLLDLRNENYRDSHSFDRIKKAVAIKKDGPTEHYYLPTSTAIWDSLRNLFRLIDRGSQELKIDHLIHIPAYNGGLFEPGEENRQLDKWTIGDSFLGDAIDLLSRSGIDERGMGFVDYSTLEIRHLGSIYEGLLEYKLMVAKSDLVVVGSKKERRWITFEEYNQNKSKKKLFEEFEEFDRAKMGELYLTTDRGERKATGSYYTPDYIVNYIVANTVGPVVEERWKLAEENKSSEIDATLSVKVIDPAMGSGHFLVGAVEFLAVKLMAAAQRDIEAGLVEDDGQFTNDWAKREAVSHCVYGVDLNDMAVELAKVSLWLTTISKEKPLSFLDHRLKKGNSLIGARLSDLKNYPGGKRKDESQTSLPSFVSPLFIKNLIGKIKELEGIEEDTLSDIKRKEKIFEEFKELPQYTKAKAIANVHTSLYFGNQIEPTRNKDSEMVYHDMFWGVAGDDAEWRRKTWGQWFKQAQEMADQRAFFHWELEFPEIFFEAGSIKENPGWDAVIGNPPYFSMERVTYLQPVFEKLHSEIYAGKLDISNYFIKRGLDLVRKHGYVGYITARYFLEAIHGVKLRDFCSKNAIIRNIIDFGNYQVFDANVLTIILLLEGDPNRLTNYNVEILKYDELSSEISLALPCKGFKRFQMPSAKFSGKSWFINEPQIDNFINKVKLISQSLIEICRIGKGMESGLNEAFVVTRGIIEKWNLEHERIRNHVQGKDLTRYSVNHRNLYLIYNENIDDLTKFPFVETYLTQFKDKLEKRKNFILGNCKWYSYGSPLNTDIYECASEKLIVPYMATHARFGYDSCNDPERFFTLTDTTIMVLKEANSYKLKYILSILNSSLLNYIHQSTSKLKRDGYYEYFSKTMEHLPIRRISFSTLEPERARLAAELKGLYQAGKFEDILSSVEACLPKDSHGNFVTAQEKSDVVHDLLGFLAEQMLEMNKQKQQEIKGFLSWLEGEVGANVDDLIHKKTKVQEYYNLQFEELLAILKENKSKLNNFNPSRRDNQEDLLREFDASVGKLKPLMESIAATDKLIDQIVYKLYGLSDKDVGIVEEVVVKTI